MRESQPDQPSRGSWATLFHQTSDAVFLLNPRRRLRYVNKAFETLTRAHAEDVVHEYCHGKKIQKDLPAGRRALLQTLSPPKEAMDGRIVRVRRTVPPAKLGPPWWDITFIPLREKEKLIGVIGIIIPAGQPGSTAGGKGLSEALVELRQLAVDRVPLSLFDGDKRIRSQAELAAQSLAPVWISGESGTGKETLARAIHYHGQTRERSFAAIDCAGLQPYLIRSILFGHNGLAETGRVGTIYLPSAERLPADMQLELVEWSESLAEKIRIAVGTAPEAAHTPEFRATFDVIEIRLKPLAEKRDELPDLIAKTISEANAAGVSNEALLALVQYSWPGNYRALREVIRDVVQRAGGSEIGIDHLPRRIVQSATDAQAAVSPQTNQSPPLEQVLEQVERRMIELALRKTRGDQTAAAELLGIYRSRLFRRIKALGISEAAD